MYFKRIEMIGFKSFADRLEINFDTGITAIVGPNGCGKSNVGDAIRWVLGEQSSKALRGSSMQDVIFSGTERRKSLSYCEATLVFDNTDRYFNLEYDELAITRKLYRSGESEYMINRTPCRLKDIVNLFYDSGIGRDGYSIIGQGQVAEIFNAKPENRRLIFEEAAGIAKFRNRKVEAERKLERTRDNLTRLKDIIAEVERQLGPLKKQAENAKKYLEFKGNLKDLEVNAYIYQFDNANETKAKINEKMRSIEEELNVQQAKLEEASNKYAFAMDEINNIDKKINNLHDQILNLTVEMEKQSGEIKLVRERINYMNSQNDKVSLDILNTENSLLKNKTEIEVKQEEIENTKQELSILKESYNEVSEKYIKIVGELTNSEDEAEQSQKSMIDTMEKIADIKANISKYKAEKELLIAESEKLGRTLLEIEEKINNQQKQEKSAKEFLDKAQQESENYGKQYSDNKLSIDLLTSQIKDNESEIHSIIMKLEVYENRKKMLSDMQKEFDGYAYSVKKLLKESEKNTNIKNKMLGVLANLIKVPEKYENAIETALGNALQNIVTVDEEDAKELINFLKRNEFGRATFLPVTAMRPRNINDNDRQLIKTNGCFGVASDLISFSPQIKSVILNLLGATIIVENLDIAIQIAQNSQFSYKVVTLDGDIVNPQGSMTGGSKKSETVNLISREREIETLTKACSEMREQLIDKKENLKRTLEQLEVKKQQTGKLELNKNQSEIVFARENERLQNIEKYLESLNNQREIANSDKNTIDEKVNFISSQLDDNGLENNVVVSRTDVDEKIAERQKKNAELKSKREDYNSNMSTLRVAIVANETNIENLQKDIDRLNEEIVVKEKTLIDYKNEFARNRATIDQAEEIIKNQLETQTNVEIKQKLDALRSTQVALENSKETHQQDVKLLDEQKIKISEEINAVNDKKYKQDMLLAKVDTDIEAMQTRIYEEYELNYSSCQEFKRPDFEIVIAMKEIAELKREISKLGYVNVNAIEESKLVLERYEDLSTQATDLENAEQDLTQIIKELSGEMVVRFKEQFDKINDNFKITFRELFGGGNAKLELLGDDLLEAGVDIVAEPPGKKLQNISLLSGGEKALTAIAIMFSILKLRPMPFCLLDEIEAALDDANVERFAQYLRRFAKTTQFIVITHRKPTMELADSLYGVTMEEKGVSKMVSVKLSDAVKNVEVK